MKNICLTILQTVLFHSRTFTGLLVYLIEHITRDWQIQSLEYVFTENLFAQHLNIGVSLSLKSDSHLPKKKKKIALFASLKAFPFRSQEI